jgi:hypothetical protein
MDAWSDKQIEAMRKGGNKKFLDAMRDNRMPDKMLKFKDIPESNIQNQGLLAKKCVSDRPATAALHPPGRVVLNRCMPPTQRPHIPMHAHPTRRAGTPPTSPRSIATALRRCSRAASPLASTITSSQVQLQHTSNTTDDQSHTVQYKTREVTFADTTPDTALRLRFGRAVSGVGDANGMEALAGESEQDYVQRQARLRMDAKKRMAEKFGGPAGGMQVCVYVRVEC